MTKISKKIITWFLGAIAFVAIAFGIVFTNPQTKLASADTAVTFNAAMCEDGEAKDDYFDFRINTSVLAWNNSANDVAAADWRSVSDYTIINGKTITEINNAATGDMKIRLTLQPAGSFSFVRLHIPNTIISSHNEVRAIGFLDGWSFTIGGQTYTSAATVFFRNGTGFYGANEHNLALKTGITIGDIALDRGAYKVNIDFGEQLASKYDPMYGGNYEMWTKLRDFIYINGKSVNEWNAEMIAKDPKYATPSTYTEFPQNSTDPSHPDTFCKPVVVWGTSTGFQLCIWADLVDLTQDLVVTMGQGWENPNNWIVAERVSKTLIDVEAIDKELSFHPQGDLKNNQGESYNTQGYLIRTKNTYWTKAPQGGCLNEYDWKVSGAGQEQMHYIYFNGVSLADINANDNGSYGSTQPNIASGGRYAPILVMMGADDNGSFIQLQIPAEFYAVEGKTSHESIKIAKGFYVEVEGVRYTATQDVEWLNNNGSWELKMEETQTTVTSVKLVYELDDPDKQTNPFLAIQVDGNDYGSANTYAGGVNTVLSYAKTENFYSHVLVDDKPINQVGVPGEGFLNVWGKAPGHFTVRSGNNYNTATKITIKAGLKLPTYNNLANGELEVYVVSEDVTFEKNDAGEWVRVEASTPDEGTKISTTVEMAQIFGTTDAFAGIKVAGNDYAAAGDTYSTTDADVQAKLKSYAHSENFLSHVLFDGVATTFKGQAFLNVWNNTGYFSFRPAEADYDATSITILAGLELPTYNNLLNGANEVYVVSEDVTFVKHEGVWMNQQDIPTNIPTTVTSAKLVYENAEMTKPFLGIQVDGNDYAAAGNTYGGTVNTAKSYAQSANFLSHVLINGNALSGGYTPGEAFLNVWGSYGYFTVRAQDSYHEVTSITIKKGLELPTYDNLLNGTKEMYVVSEDATFIKYNGEWINEKDKPTEISTTVEMAEIFIGGDNTAFAGIKVAGNDYTAAGDTYAGTVNTAQTYAHSENFLSHVYFDDVATAFKGQAFLNVWGNFGYFSFRPAAADYDATKITIKAGLILPTYNNLLNGANEVYVVSEDATFVKHNGAWMNENDIPTEILKTVVSAKMITSGAENPFLGISLTDNDYTPAPDTYSNSKLQTYAKSANFYEHVLVDDKPINQVGVPGEFFLNVWNNKGYFTVRSGDSYNNVTKITILAGLELPTYNSLANGAKEVYVVSEDATFVKVGNAWVNENNVLTASDITISAASEGGDANELYKVSILANKWNWTGGIYDLNYDGSIPLRQNLFINGVSVQSINSIDDSDYVYSTFPMSNNQYTGDQFSNPVLVYAEGNMIQLWIHKNYIESLGVEDVTVTVGVGFELCNTVAGEEVSKNIFEIRTYLVAFKNHDGSSLGTQRIQGGQKITNPPTPVRPAGTYTTAWDFVGWVDNNGNLFNIDTQPVAGTLTLTATFREVSVVIEETKVAAIEFQNQKSNNEKDNWLIFILSNHDYGNEAVGKDEATQRITVDELRRIGFLENVVFYGQVKVGGEVIDATETGVTLGQIGLARTALVAFWSGGTFGVSLADFVDYNSVTKIVINAGCHFPSYQYACLGNTEFDIRFSVPTTMEFTPSTEQVKEDVLAYKVIYGSDTEVGLGISMEKGAAIRVGVADDFQVEEGKDYMETSGYKQSGIRFQTTLTAGTIENLQAKLAAGVYDSVSFGTLILPTESLMGGNFTHQWLDANEISYLDIESTAWLTATDSLFADKDSEGNVTFFGSMLKVKTANYTRYFSGLGYIKVVKGEDVEYFYAPYLAANKRSIAYIANAAIADSDAAYSTGELNFLSLYVDDSMTSHLAAPQDIKQLGTNGDKTLDAALSDTSSVKVRTVTIGEELAGSYVKLQYQTDFDVWGRFYYTEKNGSTQVAEDFYLQKGTSEHKQFLDIYRKNGVGTLAGIVPGDTIVLDKIEFRNATVDQKINALKAPVFRLIGVYSSNRQFQDSNALQVYLTSKDGSITIGANLGLGGSLTYLAKAGLYEGLTSSSNYNANIALKNSNSFAGKSYGSASSRSEDGAVNLINNYDAGRQIQQAWYAGVGGDKYGNNNGANGYTRATSSTDGDTIYWPYNPVQAGDTDDNPSQIIDYEVNEARGYIYVKTRAMDWAKQKEKSGLSYASNVVTGVTTKSYMENYYRLNEYELNGKTAIEVEVDNAYIDWNGFTNMKDCDFTSNELPAVYPIQSMNYFVSYTASEGAWTGALTYNNGLGAWNDSALNYTQSNVDRTTKGYLRENWVAWANDASGTVGLGIYIPNVTAISSGRSKTSTSYYLENFSTANIGAEDCGLVANKALFSNMQPVDGYTFKGAYVRNTSYSAPSISLRMEAYVPMEYTYILCVDSIDNMRSIFQNIEESGRLTNAGVKTGDRVGLDAWGREDKAWTWA